LERKHQPVQPAAIHFTPACDHFADTGITITERILEFSRQACDIGVYRNLGKIAAVDKHLGAGADGGKQCFDQHFIGLESGHYLFADLDLAGSNEGELAAWDHRSILSREWIYYVAINTFGGRSW
jgi:hypothetical protein